MESIDFSQRKYLIKEISESKFTLIHLRFGGRFKSDRKSMSLSASSEYYKSYLLNFRVIM